MTFKLLPVSMSVCFSLCTVEGQKKLEDKCVCVCVFWCA